MSEFSLEQMLTMDGIEGLGEALPNVIEVPAMPINVMSDTNPFFKTKMLQTINDVDEYSWKRGEQGGLDWGFEGFNKAFEGLNTGVHLFAGQSNVGKSGIMMQMGWQIAQSNQIPTVQNPRKAFVLYFSLDDSNNELLPRLVAIDQKIPINAVRFPKKYQDNKHFMDRRKVGFENLKNSVMHINMMDVNEGSDIEHIEATAERYALELAKLDPAYQIVLMIDNFHDITVRDVNFGSDGSGKYDYISDQLSRIASKFDCPIICTAEFRKLNGNRRPKLDDIRESVKIIYEAKAIILCYNEVGLRGQQSQIFWTDPSNPDKQPVFECQIGKNKFGSFKGRCFFEFMPSLSYFKEVPAAGAVRYNQMISS
jgi:replicative DNA helicase